MGVVDRCEGDAGTIARGVPGTDEFDPAVASLSCTTGKPDDDDDGNDDDDDDDDAGATVGLAATVGFKLATTGAGV